MKEISPEEAAKLGVMRMPDPRELEEVFAAGDFVESRIKRGQRAFRSSNKVRVFVPLEVTLEGERLCKCFDCDPDSLFWTAHPDCPTIPKAEL